MGCEQTHCQTASLLEQQRIRKGNNHDIWWRPRKSSCICPLQYSDQLPSIIVWVRNVPTRCYSTEVRFGNVDTGILIWPSIRCGSKWVKIVIKVDHSLLVQTKVVNFDLLIIYSPCRLPFLFGTQSSHSQSIVLSRSCQQFQFCYTIALIL
jgi:hypothetical protein